MGKAIIDISCELLRDVLCLPDDASVLYSLQSEWPDTMRFVVEAPEIPETKLEGVIPHLAPTFSRVEVPSTVTMLSWGFGKV